MNEQSSQPEHAAAPLPIFGNRVLQAIRQHARSSMEAEVCGILIGTHEDGSTHVEASIQGEKASQAAAHVTFTQETWEHIYKEKDSKYPKQQIVGWYHSHPGFGVFLSAYDLFIQENFFSATHQIAWVFDPHSDEEGAFGWMAGRIVPLPQITVRREAGSVNSAASDDKSQTENIQNEPQQPTASKEAASPGSNPSRRPERKYLPPVWVTVVTITSMIAGFFLGASIARRSPDSNSEVWRESAVLRNFENPKDGPPKPKPGENVNKPVVSPSPAPKISPAEE